MARNLTPIVKKAVEKLPRFTRKPSKALPNTHISPVNMDQLWSFEA